MAARLTLDRNAMQALLDSMSPEAKVEFTNKVLRTVLDRFVVSEIDTFMQKNNAELTKKIFEEHLTESWKHVGLREIHEAKLRKAVQDVLKNEVDKAVQTFSERVREAQAKASAAVEASLSASGILLKAKDILKKAATEECREVMRRLTTRVSFLADEVN